MTYCMNIISRGIRITRSQRFQKIPILLSKIGNPNAWLFVLLMPLETKCNTVPHLESSQLWFGKGMAVLSGHKTSFDKYLFYIIQRQTKEAFVPSCISRPKCHVLCIYTWRSFLGKTCIRWHANLQQIIVLS